MPKISIIVPVYNSEKYLHRCIDSILAQSYKDFELVLIDDGSTDSSGKICDEYAENKNNVMAVHQPNSGVSAARNNGLKHASGVYITFVDADDYIDKDHLESMMKTLQKEQADIVINGMRMVYENINAQKKCEECASRFLLDGMGVAHKMLYQAGLDSHSWGILFSKKLGCEFLFSVGVVCGEDLVTIFKYYVHSNKVVLSSDITYNYFQNEASVMHSVSLKKLRDSMETADWVYEQCIRKYPQLVKAAEAKKFSNYCQAFLEIDDDNSDTWEMRKKIKAYLQQSKRSILMDKNTRLKNKLAALLLFGGFPAFKMASKLNALLRKK